MADITVEVPGIGEVDFPDTMSDAQISAAIRRSLTQEGPTGLNAQGQPIYSVSSAEVKGPPIPGMEKFGGYAPPMPRPPGPEPPEQREASQLSRWMNVPGYKPLFGSDPLSGGIVNLGSGIQQAWQEQFNRDPRAWLEGVNKMARGAMALGTPAILEAAVKAPLQFGAGMAGMETVPWLLKKLGLDPTYADAAGNYVGIVGAGFVDALRRGEIPAEKLAAIRDTIVKGAKAGHFVAHPLESTVGAAAEVAGRRFREALTGERPLTPAQKLAAAVEGPPPPPVDYVEALNRRIDAFKAANAAEPAPAPPVVGPTVEQAAPPPSAAPQPAPAPPEAVPQPAAAAEPPAPAPTRQVWTQEFSDFRHRQVVTRALEHGHSVPENLLTKFPPFQSAAEEAAAYQRATTPVPAPVSPPPGQPFQPATLQQKLEGLSPAVQQAILARRARGRGAPVPTPQEAAQMSPQEFAAAVQPEPATAPGPGPAAEPAPGPAPGSVEDLSRQLNAQLGTQEPPAPQPAAAKETTARGEARKQANREAAAQRWVDRFSEGNFGPDYVNQMSLADWVKLAKQFGEKKPPGDETIAVIKSKMAPAAETPAPQAETIRPQPGTNWLQPREIPEVTREQAMETSRAYDYGQQFAAKLRDQGVSADTASQMGPRDVAAAAKSARMDAPSPKAMEYAVKELRKFERLDALAQRFVGPEAAAAQ